MATWSKKSLQIGKVMTTESTSRTQPGLGGRWGRGGCWTHITCMQTLCRQTSQASPEGQLWTLRHEHQFSPLHCQALGLLHTLGSGEAEHLHTNRQWQSGLQLSSSWASFCLCYHRLPLWMTIVRHTQHPSSALYSSQAIFIALSHLPFSRKVHFHPADLFSPRRKPAFPGLVNWRDGN